EGTDRRRGRWRPVEALGRCGWTYGAQDDRGGGAVPDRPSGPERAAGRPPGDQPDLPAAAATAATQGRLTRARPLAPHIVWGASFSLAGREEGCRAAVSNVAAETPDMIQRRRTSAAQEGARGWKKPFARVRESILTMRISASWRERTPARPALNFSARRAPSRRKTGRRRPPVW